MDQQEFKEEFQKVIESYFSTRKLLNLYLRDPIEPILVGCTDEEIQELMFRQKVDYLPPIYCYVMKQGGKTTRLISQVNHRYQDVISHKGYIYSEIQLGFAYDILLSDYFIFADYALMNYYFFRTVPPNPDPPVYVFELGARIYVLCSEHLSKFFLSQGRC